MNPVIKQQWVSALQSQAYIQGKGSLRTSGDAGDKYCCLGVLCDLYHKETKQGTWQPPGESLNYNAPDDRVTFILDGNDYGSLIPDDVEQWAGIDRMQVNRCVQMNDRKAWSFGEIASVIESEF